MHDFLSRLFHDGDLIPLPFQKWLAPWIAKRRTPKIEEQYAKIGGSPILKWTEHQGAAMTALLDELSPQTAPHKPYVAFRYAKPYTDMCLDQLEADGVKRVVLFTQYPQYSCSTTGSSLNEMARQIQKRPGLKDVEWTVLDRWATHPGFVEVRFRSRRRSLCASLGSDAALLLLSSTVRRTQSMAQVIERGLESYAPEDRKDVIVLYSAHSLPMTVVNRGDPYPSLVAASVEAIQARLGHSNPHKLVWQSKVGPQPWLGPQTMDVIENFHKQGKDNLLLVPVAFTSDHIETLFELDMEYVHDATHELGMKGVKRAEALNGSSVFARALADLMAEHLARGGQNHTRELELRCPGCFKQSCIDMRSLFVDGQR